MRHIILISGVSVCILLVVLLYKLNKTKMEYDTKFIAMNRKVRDLTNLIDLSNTKSKLLNNSEQDLNNESVAQTQNAGNQNQDKSLEKEYESFVNKNETFFGNLDKYDIPENVKNEIDNFVSAENNPELDASVNTSNDTNINPDGDSPNAVSPDAVSADSVNNENACAEPVNNENVNESDISQAFDNYNFDEQTIQMADVVDLESKAGEEATYFNQESIVESNNIETIENLDNVENVDVVENTHTSKVSENLEVDELQEQNIDEIEELEVDQIEGLAVGQIDELEVEELAINEELSQENDNVGETLESINNDLEDAEPELKLDFGKLDEMSVKELQEICRSNKLKIKGRKDELVSRIKSNLIVNNL